MAFWVSIIDASNWHKFQELKRGRDRQSFTENGLEIYPNCVVMVIFIMMYGVQGLAYCDSTGLHERTHESIET